MVKQAASVGQLLAALTRAVEEQNGTVNVSFSDGQYAARVIVNGRNVVDGTGPKLFRLMADVGAKYLATRTAPPAIEKLRGRIGDLATPGAMPDISGDESEEDEPSERF